MKEHTEWELLVDRIKRLLAVEAAALAVVESEGASTRQRTEFWAAVDHLREVLDA